MNFFQKFDCLSWELSMEWLQQLVFALFVILNSFLTSHWYNQQRKAETKPRIDKYFQWREGEISGRERDRTTITSFYPLPRIYQQWIHTLQRTTDVNVNICWNLVKVCVDWTEPHSWGVARESWTAACSSHWANISEESLQDTALR